MRVLIVNTSEATGGAAIAASRLMEALKSNGVKATMMVRDKHTSQITVSSVGSKWMMALRFVWERLIIFLSMGMKKQNIWQVDFANAGADITKTDEFKNADVVHLHWVNQGFISLSGIKKILDSGKKVVVTMHDMWYFTGICHHAAQCDKYKTECKDCLWLKGKLLGRDWANHVFNKKKKIYENSKITFVGCSKWMKEKAESSALTCRNEVVAIPNPINTKHFAPMDKAEQRKKMRLPDNRKLILFGSRKVTDPYKGFSQLVEACNILVKNYPALAENITVVVVGSNSAEVKNALPLDVVTVDYVDDERQMISLYNAVDLYVTPSLQENLPNTIMEAMACAVPCVGFNVGGIPEMIDHKQTGYLAKYKDSNDFAEGIVWALQPENYGLLATKSREKALKEYSESHIARLYTQIYEG